MPTTQSKPEAYLPDVEEEEERMQPLSTIAVESLMVLGTAEFPQLRNNNDCSHFSLDLKEISTAQSHSKQELVAFKVQLLQKYKKQLLLQEQVPCLICPYLLAYCSRSIWDQYLGAGGMWCVASSEAVGRQLFFLSATGSLLIMEGECRYAWKHGIYKLWG